MDPRVVRLKTPQECATFAKNASDRGFPLLAEQARQKAIQLRAEAYGAKTAIELECLEAVYAYEEVLSIRNGRRQTASRTWPMIHNRGIIAAVEHIVLKRGESLGYTSLVEMGLKEFAFEAVILRHPEFFSPEAVARSRERLAQVTDG
jgi:hypothetical protein